MDFPAVPIKYFALVDFSLSCKPVLARLHFVGLLSVSNVQRTD